MRTGWDKNDRPAPNTGGSKHGFPQGTSSVNNLLNGVSLHGLRPYHLYFYEVYERRGVQEVKGGVLLCSARVDDRYEERKSEKNQEGSTETEGVTANPDEKFKCTNEVESVHDGPFADNVVDIGQIL